MLSRRGFLASLLPPAKTPPPNLVIFLSDDHGLLDSSVYGAQDAPTPNMQRLAHQGMVFTHAFVASPSCAPSRAALLTGLYPARNGAEANHTKPRPEIRKLPSYLKELGYETAAFGKVSHYRYTADYGFDTFGHDTIHDPQAIPSALNFLAKRNSTKPLALFVGSNWPHVPWPTEHPAYPNLTHPAKSVPTPETREARAQYLAAVANMDAELGQVYDAARARFGDNMVFLLTSDHGAQWPFGKWNLYDTGIRTPLIVAWPGVIRPHQRTAAMVQWIDLLPTLIDLAGGPPPQGLDGRSFAPVLRGSARQHRPEIFTTHSGDGDWNVFPIRAVRTPEWKYIRNLHPELQHSTHTNRDSNKAAYRYWQSWEREAQTNPQARALVEAFKRRPAEELYDLRKDPDERVNLAADPRHTRTLNRLRARLDAWLKETNDSQKLFGKPLPRDAEALPLR
ncbi:MAG: sulfatase [Acidobacteriota bacterium]